MDHWEIEPLMMKKVVVGIGSSLEANRWVAAEDHLGNMSSPLWVHAAFITTVTVYLSFFVTGLEVFAVTSVRRNPAGVASLLAPRS